VRNRKSEVGSRKARNTLLTFCLPIPRSALRTPHSGYTLVEMLLVLAVIGTLAAAAWPSVLRMQADHDLSAAAEQVRQQLGNARSWSIKTGVKFQFRFEPKGHHFVAVPFEAEPEPDPKFGNNTAAAAVQYRFGGELSKRISFLPMMGSTSLQAAMSSNKLPEAAVHGLPNAGALMAVNWSDPVIFSPEGTAMDALITLADPRGHRIDISIRGLTGAAAIGPMRREAVR
jgi:prepilin-type N-terminal cleavage/methylation domain-containing protein